MSSPPIQSEAPVSYCQNCGKPLTAETVRSVAGHVYCEPCLAQRLGVPQPGAAGQPMPPMPPMSSPAYPPVRNSPVLAGLLGFIPGVGAMYNGQVAKGLVHVMIFIALIGATDHFDLFGILIAAWVFYQVFDAYQTADALRRGMPVPDHLGLNQIAARLGLQSHTNAGYPPPPVAPADYTAPPYGGGPVPPAGGFVAPGFVAPGYVAPGYVAPGYVAPGYVPPADYVPPPDPGFNPGMPGLLDEPTHRSFPVGAIVLVALGVLFLLGTAGIIGMHWVHHGWPILLIGLGLLIVFRNSTRFRGGPR
jgi:TM2 domain-containing membrane protein YozV